jgi:general secretion pathway protein F/type IV pilus assembly protein PilC
MPDYAYVARSANGEDVAGTIVAASLREAIAILAERSLYPLKVEPVRERFRVPFRRRVGPSQLATSLTQLSDLLQNGVPLLAALGVLAEQTVHPELRRVLVDVREKVAEGTAIDQALAAHPHVFGELVVSMVRAGAEGAFLEDALKRTADFLEMQEEVRSRVKGAMFYPAFLAIVGTVITAALIVFFVPKFAELFEKLEREGGGLPFATVLLLNLSDFLGRFGGVVFLGVIALVLGIRQLIRSPAGRRWFDQFKLRMPVLGPIFLHYAVSRFCRVLGTLLKNGVPLLKALEISSQSAGNRVLEEAIRKSAENVSSGETLSKPLAQCGLIPKPVMAMISVAEQANNLDEVLVQIAESVERRMARQIDLMVRMVEPAMLLVMGVIIMFVLVALLLPIIEISTSL